MSSRSLFSALVALGLLLLGGGCAPPRAGAACSTGDRYDCEDSRTAIECRDAVWRTLPCRGPTGCESSGGQVLCDISKNAAGDACGYGAEGTGLCSTDGHATLECRDGVLIQTNACPGGCSSDGTHLSCR